MAHWVKEGDPGAKLFTNDYDMIGVQGHLHGDSLDVDALRHALDTLAQFKLPIRITEFNFPGQRSKYDNQRDAKLTPEEEQAKALALRQFYRVAFAHPAVAGIMMWGFREGANWIPVSSLYRRDWTPTPAAEACRDLVFRQWWTQWSGTADASGVARIPAFYGTYLVTIDGRREERKLSR